MLEKIRNYFKGGAQQVYKTSYLPVGVGSHLPVDANGDMVYATCIKILSSYLAQTRWSLYGNDNKEVANIMQPLHRVLNVQPYPNWSAYDLWSFVETQRNATGNGFCYLKFDEQTNLQYIAPLDARYMQVYWDDANILDGRKLVYQYTEQRTGQTYTMLPEEVFHVKANAGANGIVGRSALSVLGDTLTSNATAEQSLRQSIANGYSGTILLTYTSDLSKGKQDVLLKTVMDNLKKSDGKVLPLPVGMNAVNINNNVSAMVDLSKKYNAQAISAFFGVPTCMLNMDGTSGQATVSTNMIAGFYNATIAPIVAQYAQQLTLKLLTQRQIAKGYMFDTAANSFEHLDASTMASVISTYVGAGVLTPNEARQSLKYYALDEPMADRLTQRGGTGTLGDGNGNEGGRPSDN